MVRAIVGGNWGDEGKGKMTDLLAEKSDIVVRYQGGANAGHTIINNYGKFALHLLPSGVFRKNVTNVIAQGVALNIPILFNELDNLKSKGVPAPELKISDRAQVVMPYHILFDRLEEERLGKDSFEELPLNARSYVEFVEKELGYPVKYISNGPNREDIILRNDFQG